MIDSLGKWFLFGVAMGLLPLLFAIYRAWINNRTDLLAIAFGRGELLLLAVSLCGASLGDLLWTRAEFVSAEGFLAGCLALLIASGAFMYADQTAAGRTPRIQGTPTAIRHAVILYLLALVISGVSVAFRAEE